jgi:hypothetical protein
MKTVARYLVEEIGLEQPAVTAFWEPARKQSGVDLVAVCPPLRMWMLGKPIFNDAIPY